MSTEIIEKKEQRFFTGTIGIQKRAGDEESRTIEGYAVVFDRFSSVLGSSYWAFKEKISRTAFDGVDMSGVIATFNHNFDNVLARVDAGNLKLTIDETGLKYEFEAPNTTVGNDLLENVRNGNISGSSFMFTTDEERWTYKDDESIPDEREIVKIRDLYELGPVTIPAYPDTTAAKRSHEESKPTTGWHQRRAVITKLSL